MVRQLLLYLPTLATASKIGGCINSSPIAEASVPSDPYIVSEIYSGNSCTPFTKAVNAFGLLFVANTAGQDVPENGLKWLATATTELFPASATDAAKQKEVLQNMFRYRAANPVFVAAFVDQMEPARDVLSMCDTITIGSTEDAGNVNGQIMEVYEHLLHIISDVGFSTTWPSKWGLSTASDLYLAMQEAISAGVYDVSSYAGIDAEARTRIELQEFAYWALSTSQGVHATYFQGSAAPEWTLTTAAQVQAQLPLFWALHTATSATVLGVPSAGTFTALGSLSHGQTPQTAPWPIVDAGRGTLPAGDPLADPCGGGGAAGGGGSTIAIAVTIAAVVALLLLAAAWFFRMKTKKPAAKPVVTKETAEVC